MSSLRRRWVIFRHPHAEVRIHPSAYLGPGFSLDMPRGGTFIAGPRVEFRRGFRAEFGSPEARIEIGADSRFTYYVLIQCSTRIRIGDRCVFAQATVILDGQHRYRDLTKPMVEQGYDFREIEIGDDAAVMSKCNVMASVGRRAFIGANTVVTREVPPYTLAVGAPAKAVDYFGPERDDPVADAL